MYLKSIFFLPNSSQIHFFYPKCIPYPSFFSQMYIFSSRCIQNPSFFSQIYLFFFYMHPQSISFFQMHYKSNFFSNIHLRYIFFLPNASQILLATSFLVVKFSLMSTFQLFHLTHFSKANKFKQYK